jgi:hypothetical protein
MVVWIFDGSGLSIDFSCGKLFELTSSMRSKQNLISANFSKLMP